MIFTEVFILIKPAYTILNEFIFRLNYKYSRLIDSSQSRDGELPAADVCAFEEGEEEEDDVTNFHNFPNFLFFHI